MLHNFTWGKAMNKNTLIGVGSSLQSLMSSNIEKGDR